MSQIDPALIDIAFEPDGALGDWHDEEAWLCCGNEVSVFPDKYRVPRSEYDDRMAALEGATADDHCGRFTHQGKSHECVCHSATMHFESCFNRQLGLGYQVWFSPLALYTRLTRGRQWGGSNVQHSLRVMIAEGMLPEHDGPDGHNAQHDHRFKVTIHQTSGRSEAHWPTKGWIRQGDFPGEWQETAKHFRVLEAYTIPDREAHASALLQGWAVSNGRNGHAICHTKLVKDGGRYLSHYRDSYNVRRYDSESLWGGGFCIKAVTMPDDPTKPAGEQMK